MALPDCYDYVRRTYGVPAYIGVRVRLTGSRDHREGVIVPARTDLHYIHIQFDGAKFSYPAHPTDGVTYLVEGRTHSSSIDPQKADV